MTNKRLQVYRSERFMEPLRSLAQKRKDAKSLKTIFLISLSDLETIFIYKNLFAKHI